MERFFLANQNPNTSAPNVQPPDPFLACRQGLAAQARCDLARLGFYLARDLAADSGFDHHEANIRTNLLTPPSPAARRRDAGSCAQKDRGARRCAPEGS
jgi:hypothetical protein